MAEHTDLAVLKHLAYNVFLPPKLPQNEQEESFQKSVDLEIVRSVIQAGRQYASKAAAKSQWSRIEPMLERLYKYVETPIRKNQLYEDMQSMGPKDSMFLHIRAQNTGLIIRRQIAHTTFEAFEVQARTVDVMSIPGKIVRQFPGPAVEVSNTIFGDRNFIKEVANILTQMDTEMFDKARPKSRKGGNEVDESRDSINPNYFIQYFFGFLLGMGTTVDPPRVVKRLGDEVLWKDALNPWRRSPIWLVVRIGLQTSLDSATAYKHFMAYYHAEILSRCYKCELFSSNLLYAMRMKMARRLYKLKDTAPHFLLEAAKDAAEGTQKLLQRRWDSIQSAQAKSPNRDFSDIDFKPAIDHKLPHSRNYLERVFRRRVGSDNSSKFTPNDSLRLEDITRFSEYANGGLSCAFTSGPHMALFDFEASVFNNLASWTSIAKQRNCCSVLYTGDAGDQSMMLLTLVRIWMAIDELVTEDCSLLREFSPELPDDILDSLLLRTTQQIEQARVIQQYIRRRRANASTKNPSIFSDNATDECFAVRYYRNSLNCQQLKEKIEKNAHEQKNQKIKEMKNLNEKYDMLSRQIQGMSHEYAYTNGQQNHSKWSCGLCGKNRERSDLKIRPYEWPLPTDQLDAEAVIFELKRPELFTIWRDITYEVLVDLSSLSPRDECTQYMTLEGYDALNSWLSAPSKPRITIASATKSFQQSHYSGTLTIPTTESKACLKNALQFRLYDRNREAWATGPFHDVAFARFGTFELPSGSRYSHLEYTIAKKTHTSNQVLADQHICPTELGLHEHIAFGTLRSGARLQWMNIVRGLEEDLLTFDSDEVWLLHTQAAWQIGPLSDDGSREWHEELGYVEFGDYLFLSADEYSVASKQIGCRPNLFSPLVRILFSNIIKSPGLTLSCVIVTLVLRLITASPPEGVTHAACDFLREARYVAYGWLKELLKKLRNATYEEDITGYQLRVCEMASICRATYDVEPVHLERLLWSSGDFIPLVEASIRLYDNQPPCVQNSPISLQILQCRDRRFAHKVMPYMLTRISGEDAILSEPLAKVWSGYQSGTSGWQILASPNDCWANTMTGTNHEGEAQDVHLNLLSGRLLIDGKPIGRLPRQYVEHGTYIRLFGQKILDVAPTKLRGMKFAMADCIDGYQVSFALEESEGELIIQAEKKNQHYELVPHKKLSDDFPLSFSNDYHHWADVKNKTIEFRPISDPWSPDKCQWILRFAGSGGTTLENTSGNYFLVDIHSGAFKTLARSLSPLESNRYLHVTRLTKGHVEVELPRMKFSFFINEDMQLESRNFRGQVLDENQSAGTLFGLKNQLLLRAKGSVARTLPQSRSVLIPDGEIDFTTHGHHVSVSIQLDSRRTMDVYRYKIDEDLGYLATDAGLTSRLFKTYLHALTSHCLPDPLTGRTGTEEALSELSQGSTSSFDQITAKQAELLQAIGLLTPRREYYPQHLECMQTTHWGDLPSLSQHFAFSFGATAVLRRADMLQLFHNPKFELSKYITALETSNTLLQRAGRRTSSCYQPDIGHTLHILSSGSAADRVRPGRDALAGEWEEAGQAARWASSLAHQKWGSPVFKSYDLISLLSSWRTLHDPEKRKTLSYRSSWFDLNLKTSWIGFYNLLRRAETSSNRFMLSSCLAGVAFGQTPPEERELIPVFLAFATNPKFRNLDPPSQRLYRLDDEYKPARTQVECFVSAAEYPIEGHPAVLADVVRRAGESDYELYQRGVDYYRSNLPEHRSQLVRSLMNQWPRTSQQPPIQIHSPNANHLKWFDIESCLKSTMEYFSSCMWNVKLKDHLRELQVVLSSDITSSGTTFTRIDHRPVDSPVASRIFCHPWNALNFSNLMHFRLAPDATEIMLFSKFSISRSIGSSTNTSRLARLFADLQGSECPLRKQYASDLEESRKELDSKPRPSFPRQLPPTTVEDVSQTRELCKSNLTSSFQQLNSRLSPQTDIEGVIFTAGIWPRITPRSVLQQLSFQNRRHIDSLPKWRNELIGYAQVFVDYQRSQRLLSFAYSKNTEEFYKELDLASGQFDPGLDNPDWLLVHIDGNFGARALQRRVAQEMISPASGSNAVLQLNMGEGKSSVIVPIVACSLADSSQLVRVVVLKPLWRQMFDLLVNRLSGLANRQIYYLPFGRHVPIDASGAQSLRDLYEECMRGGGILLTQPEHILSFKLMGIDRATSPRDPIDATDNNSLRDIQGWLDTHTRDIFDESDEILHVRYQIVYTIGTEKPPDGHPDRWNTTQQLMHLCATHLQRLHLKYPDSLAHKFMRNGQFPTLRIMPDCPAQAEHELICAIATDVRDGRVLNLSCDRLPLRVRNNLVELLTNKKLPFSDYKSIRRDCDTTTWKRLLLVRGLLASGILVFALKHKLHRVDYGLDPSRSLLAVPYRAKDIPSLRADFGHPDVAIVLTCLSYYYRGLTHEQLNECFELLFKLDNPSLEYEQWVKQNEETPKEVKQFTGVNLEDHEQFVKQLFPAFACNSATINFYLSSVVFPRGAKEFPKKLSTSGWDLAERKCHVTTGFSGTNDNRYLLPTSIAQADPVKQLSTNALVLDYILQPENNHYACMRGDNIALLKFLAQNPEIRVLLDVGALVLELQNEELVRHWLGLRQDIEAAVYFNNRDELVVLPQGGTPVLLSTSSFAQQLDKCIVYLDDGHTRGTDLKFPRETRALVTLGPKVTKDRLLQGCMRMRKLGHGQSVMFAAPPEIDTQIRNASPDPIKPDSRIDALDILRWAMLKTCQDLKHHVSHWAQQGIEYSRRHFAEKEYERTGNLTTLEKGWTTPESRSLEEMYGAVPPERLHDSIHFTQRAFEIPDLRRGLDFLGVKRLEDPSMDEEQEREFSHEKEQQVQIQRPPQGQPVAHSIHPEVEDFINTGRVHTAQTGIIPFFHPFHDSSPQISHCWSPLVFTSVDFLQTIANSPTDRLSEYMRPVNWIVSAPDDVQVVLGPYEVNELLPLIRKSTIVKLHVYAPRVSLSMRCFSDLQFYSVTASPQARVNSSVLSAAQLQLDLFAGQLYLSNYQDYVSFCITLGLFIPSGTEDDLLTHIESDGFVKPEHRDRLIQHYREYEDCRFTASPIPVLKDLIWAYCFGLSESIAGSLKVKFLNDSEPIVRTENPSTLYTDFEANLSPSRVGPESVVDSSDSGHS
ncbi:hypothetical protein B0J17DRAFT_709438 [Rhizoctonia solani]|nr:hypothetical protein B0J17DRAFT_709438 [Rhizoctonia solani]